MNEFLHNAFKNKVLFSSTTFFLLYKLGYISKYTAGRIQLERIYKKTYKHLKRKYSKTIDKTNFSFDKKRKTSKNIWMLWFQGFDKSPEIVQECVSSVKRNFDKDWNIHLLDEKNYQNFVCLPKEILLLRKEGKISDANFSDIIRSFLLKTFGGLWIDATCFITKRIPSYIFDSPFFVFKSGYQNKEVPNFQSWFIYAQKQEPIISATFDILCKEVITNCGFNHYFYFFFVLQFVSSYCTNYWNKIPFFSDFNSYYLQGNIGKGNDKVIRENIIDLAFAQKLTYKSLSTEDKTKLLLVLKSINKKDE